MTIQNEFVRLYRYLSIHCSPMLFTLPFILIHLFFTALVARAEEAPELLSFAAATQVRTVDFVVPFSLPSSGGETLNYVIEGHTVNEIEATSAPLISLGYIDENSASIGYMEFVSSNGNPFRLRPDLCEHSEMLTVENATEGRQIRAKVLLAPKIPSGVYREKFQFYFESLETPDHIVTVPVEIYAYKIG